MAWHVDRSARETFVRLHAEDVPGTFEFLIEHRRGEPFLVEALWAPPAPITSRRTLASSD